MRELSIIIAVILISRISFSQEIQTPNPNVEMGKAYLGDVLKLAALSEEESIEISNTILVTKGVHDNLKNYILKTTDINALHFSKDSLIKIKPKLIFSKCRFVTDNTLSMAEQSLSLNVFDFTGGISINQSEFEFPSIDFEGTFDSFEFYSNKNLDALFLKNAIFSSSVNIWNHSGKMVSISNCSFHNQVLISGIHIELVALNDNVFQPFASNPCDIFQKDSQYSLVTETSLVVEGRGQELNLSKNIFTGNPSRNKVDISGNWEEIELEENRIASLLTFNGTNIQSKFELTDNVIDGKISFNGLVFSEKYNLLRWKQFNGGKLALFEYKSPNTGNISSKEDLSRAMPCLQFLRFTQAGFIYNGAQEWELKDESLFEKHIYVYQTLFNIYKLRGDIESANACYAEMRDVQTVLLRYKYETDPSFKSYFRWRIQQLLKIYTNHGTDPALAIVISLYVVLSFAIFYSFYPSEWDLTSKIKLLQNFKEFIYKNDKGYFKPFIKVVIGFTISLLNAFTLSLNAFTTLGFGEIPTKGLARYVCVIEGFIGWFLLSIFTVALINQVLA